MLIVLSPAKTLDFNTIEPQIELSSPKFIDDAAVLIKELVKYDAQSIANLMKISAKLSDLNMIRFQEWNTNHTEDSCAAISAFKGDVYQGLNAETLNIEQLNYLNKTVRILSGLYGVLKPFDALKAYRLEMGTKLPNPRGKNLYDFWGQKIANEINQSIEHSAGEKVLVNLASNEYFKSIDKKTLKYPIITPVFKDYKNGKYKIISFYAKKARGLMTRFAAQQNITEVEQLKTFNEANYEFNYQLSTDDNWVFIR